MWLRSSLIDNDRSYTKIKPLFEVATHKKPGPVELNGSSKQPLRHQIGLTLVQGGISEASRHQIFKLCAIWIIRLKSLLD